MDVSLALATVGLLVFIAHFFAALFSKSRLPDVLPLMVIGLLLGPIFKAVTPESFGAIGRAFGMLALAVILFQGGLDLRPTHLREAVQYGGRLALLNFTVTLGVVSIGARGIFDIPWIQSLLLGAILAATSAAVVIPMVEKLTLTQVSRTSLTLESAFSDVFSIVISLELIEAALDAGTFRAAHAAVRIPFHFALACLIGAGAAFVWSAILNRVRQLENSVLLTLAVVLITVGVTDLLQFSGAIAALAFGIMLGNIEDVARWLPSEMAIRPVRLDAIERSFISETAFLVRSFFFVYIGIAMPLDNWPVLGLGLAIALVLFILRPPLVKMSLARTIPCFDAQIASVMVPKGLASAVLASLPLQYGLAHGKTIQSVTYAVILFSIAIAAGLVYLLEQGRLKFIYGPYFSNFSGATSTAASASSAGSSSPDSPTSA